jgi:type II secretory pathway component PulF
MDHERTAYFADTIAALDQDTVPLDEAILLASGVIRSPALMDHEARTTPAEMSSQAATAQPAKQKQFPPFLRWALFESEPAIARQKALGMAAAIYRQASDHTMQRARIVAPIILLITIGGTVTLLYGLALFVPVVQMLKAVALTPLKGG